MILNICKPVGLTSHDVVDKVREVTGGRKVGHAGTLDPFAEGVLVVGVGRESTKKLGNIAKETEKEYIATMELGKVSDTGDPTGEIKKSGNQEIIKSLDQNKIRDILGRFQGEIVQTPPKYSAIKIKGKPAYKYAREGKEVDIPERKVKIYEIELINVETSDVQNIDADAGDIRCPKIEIRVLCSSGTYIRTLAEDIGKALGTGAYLTKLIRTRVGGYKIEDSIKLEDLNKKDYN